MAPCRLFVFDVTLDDGISIFATAADDDDASIKKTDAELTRKQIVREQLAAMQAERPEVTVLGGVNGDFFYGGITVDARNNLLHGVMYRRGVCLKETFDGGAACTVFALLKDGTGTLSDAGAVCCAGQNGHPGCCRRPSAVARQR